MSAWLGVAAMSKLLCAGFSRLKRDRMFWIGIAFMVFIGLFVPVRNYIDALESGYTVPFDNYFFGFTLFTGIIAAVFSSLFIGAEYSDGTIRNKIVVGHTRSTIYFANLIINTVAALITSLAFIIAVSAVGIPLFGFLTMDAKGVLILLFASALMTVAFAAIFTLLGMLIQNKTIVAIVSILGIIAMFFVTISIDQKLREPEFYEYYEYGAESEVGLLAEGTEGVQQIPNPNYLQPDERTAYQFFYDFLPTGQGMQIYGRAAQNPWHMQVYSLLIITATTTCGGLPPE